MNGNPTDAEYDLMWVKVPEELREKLLSMLAAKDAIIKGQNGAAVQLAALTREREPAESQVESLTEKIAGLEAVVRDGMKLWGPTVQGEIGAMWMRAAQSALTSTAPILDRIKNEAKAEALEESANEMDGGNSCSLDEKNCSNDLCRVVRVLSTRAAALREAK